MNLIKKISLVLVFGLALTPQVGKAVQNKTGITPVQIAAKTHVVTFVNNITDLAHLLDGDEAHSKAVEEAAKKALVYVNGHLVKHGESLQLPVSNNSYQLQIIMPAAGLKPFIKTNGIITSIASFVEIKALFQETIVSDENEVEILYPLIAKAEEWNTNFPSITLGYSPFFKIQVTIEDLK